jgi:hypothetical protein
VRWILFVVLIVAGLLALVTLIGWRLPKAHIATRASRLHQSPEKIWQAITDVDAMPSWREGLKSVKRLPAQNRLPAWVEISGHGEIPLETVEARPPQHLVVKIADPKLPFGGTGTYEVLPEADDSVLRITENGEIYNPIYRFLSRFVFGYTGTIDTYLQSLAKKFGEAPQLSD